MKLLLSMSLVAIATFMLSSCNTVSGMGRDVSSFGDAVGEAARNTSQALD